MAADLGALFQDDDRNLLTLLGGELLQPDRGREPGRAAADDDDVELHGFAFDSLTQSLRSKSLWLIGLKGLLRAQAGQCHI